MVLKYLALRFQYTSESNESLGIIMFYDITLVNKLLHHVNKLANRLSPAKDALKKLKTLREFSFSSTPCQVPLDKILRMNYKKNF